MQSLSSAILADDPSGVASLLHGMPHLAIGKAVAESRYETVIAHWIYVGDSLLHIAAAGYRLEIAEMLLAAGADVCAAGNHRASQPLHYAADGHLDSPAWNPERQVATIRLLLKAGADVDAQDKNGATPLHRAVRTRCAAAVECLLDAGSNAHLHNKPGSTAFHLAVQNTGRGGSGAEAARTAQEQIIRAFLDRGVSIRLASSKGKTVLESAISARAREILVDAAMDGRGPD